jgi:hydroxymethylbilane synthase
VSEEEFQKTVIGTRGSDLALVQAAATERALSQTFPDLRITRRVIRTTGDRRTDVALAQVAKVEGTDKGIFTKELEDALLAGEIDIAVHSLKDVPTIISEEFEIAGVLSRAPIRGGNQRRASRAPTPVVAAGSQGDRPSWQRTDAAAQDR